MSGSSDDDDIPDLVGGSSSSDASNDELPSLVAAYSAYGSESESDSSSSNSSWIDDEINRWRVREQAAKDESATAHRKVTSEDDDDDVPGLVGSESDSGNDSDAPRRTRRKVRVPRGKKSRSTSKGTDKDSGSLGFTRGFLNPRRKRKASSGKRKNTGGRSSGGQTAKEPNNEKTSRGTGSSDEKASDVNSQSADANRKGTYEDYYEDMPDLVGGSSSNSDSDSDSESDNDSDAPQQTTRKAHPPSAGKSKSTSKATAKDSSSTGFTKGFLNRRPKRKMPPGKKQNAGGRPGEQNAEESDKKKTSSEAGSSGAKASGKRTKKEQRMFNYITKRKKMLGGELSALKKCMKMGNAGDVKISSPLDGGKRITCTNFEVAISFFEVAFNALNQIDLSAGKILRGECMEHLDRCDVAIVYGYRFRVVEGKNVRFSQQFYETLQTLPGADRTLDYNTSLFQKIRKRYSHPIEKITKKTTSEIFASLVTKQFALKTLFFNNFFTELVENNITYVLNPIFMNGIDTKAFLLKVSDYYQAEICPKKFDADGNKFPVWDPVFGRELFQELAIVYRTYYNTSTHERKDTQFNRLVMINKLLGNLVRRPAKTPWSKHAFDQFLGLPVEDDGELLVGPGLDKTTIVEYLKAEAPKQWLEERHLHWSTKQVCKSFNQSQIAAFYQDLLVYCGCERNSFYSSKTPDFLLLEGIKLLRAVPTFETILNVAFLTDDRLYELFVVMLKILKEDGGLHKYLYGTKTCPVVTLIGRNITGENLVYMELVKLFVLQFGFDPLFPCINTTNSATNIFCRVMDMYFADVLRKNLVKEYVKLFMLDLSKPYNAYEYSSEKSQSVKLYFENKYSSANKHRKKSGDWKSMILSIQKERKKMKKKARRKKTKPQSSSMDRDGNFEVFKQEKMYDAPVALKKAVTVNRGTGKAPQDLTISEVLYNNIVAVINEYIDNPEWKQNASAEKGGHGALKPKIIFKPLARAQHQGRKVHPEALVPSAPAAPPLIIFKPTIRGNGKGTKTVFTTKNDGNEEEEASEIVDFDPSSFDSGDYEWEVVFVKKVNDFFKKHRKKNQNTCLRMFKTIGELATGTRWKNNERLKKGVSHGLVMNLWEAKPSKAERILWQITPEMSKKHGDIRDVIRVWDIVLDHDNLSSAIRQVERSHALGQDSKNRWVYKVKTHQRTLGDRTYPAVYTHLDGSDGESRNPSDLTEQYFFIEPDTVKYNPIRHYFIDSSAATALLYFEENDDFELESGGNEQETRIITRGLDPDPRVQREKKSSMLLLGRSGTGKTTCLIYRLFNEFKLFWKRSQQNEEKLKLARGALQQEMNARSAKDGNESRVSNTNDKGKDEASVPEFDETDDLARNFEDDEYYGEDFGAIFITKSQVLRSECLKQFKKLRLGIAISDARSQDSGERVMPADKHPLRLNDLPASFLREDPERDLGTQIEMGTFPMFLTADAYWRMLDNTLPGPRVKYFQHRSVPRDRAKTMGDILSTDQENPYRGLDELPADSMDLYSDSEYSSSEDSEDESGDATALRENIQYIEVTFEVFVRDFWNKIKGTHQCKDSTYNPAVVWGEIRSHIKGSIHSYINERPLAREEYVSTKVGRKQSNLSTDEREDIYNMYEKYETMRKQSASKLLGGTRPATVWYYDIMDALQDVIPRLKAYKNSPKGEQNKAVPVFTSYVDEIQDFTQVETAIIINFCKDPNRLVLAGDTAQNICSGVSFRFQDIKSMFYDLNLRLNMERANDEGGQSVPEPKCGEIESINVPSREDGTFCHLNLNFRSHDGVLFLAASVVELLYQYFPYSIDKLDPDNGIQNGPKPILFRPKSGSGHDFIMMLLGSRDTSRNVPFGASQAILVQSRDVIETLPKELAVHPLILTIQESKGLEFEGVLLYNFFKHSKAAEKTWRCIAKYMDEQKHDTLQRVDGEMSKQRFQEYCDEMKVKLRSREKDFEETEDRILESELKLLYTAITRAKTNVWIYDEDDSKSVPMFEYFERRQLVNIVESIEESKKYDFEIARSATHSPSDWISSAEMFEEKAMDKTDPGSKAIFYRLALNCYEKAIEEHKDEAGRAGEAMAEGSLEEKKGDAASTGDEKRVPRNALVNVNVRQIEESIMKCKCDLAWFEAQLIDKSTKPKMYVEGLLKAALAAANAFKTTQRKEPFGTKLYLILAACAQRSQRQGAKYYEIAGLLANAFGLLAIAKGLFEKAGKKNHVLEINKRLESSNFTKESDTSGDEARKTKEPDFEKLLNEEENKNRRQRARKKPGRRSKGKTKWKATRKKTKKPQVQVEDY